NLNDRLSRFTIPLRKKPLTMDSVASLRKKIETFLKEHRFLRSELLGPEAKYSDDKLQAQLSFRISEPYSYEFTVDGAKQMTPPDAYRALSADTIERGTSDPAAEAVDRLRQAYLKLGYPNVDVQSKVTEIPERFLRRVRILITENQRVRVREILISGRVSRPNSYYEKFLRNNSSDLIKRGFYNRQDLELGYENLLNELRNQGYLRARIQSSRLEASERPGESRIVVVMDEGPLTQVRTVDFTGNDSFMPNKLTSVLSVKANSALRLADLERSIEEIKEFYRSQGYLEMRLLNEGEELIQYNERGTQANIRFDIYEGPKVIVAEITLDGNTFTKSDVIFRTIDIKVGDILTPNKIEESEVRLNRLGVFSRASIRTMEDGTNVARRNVVISISERDPGSFRMGAGVNSERELTLRGFMGLSYNNLFGTARGISGRAELKSHVIEVNYPQYEVVASYLEPFLLNSQSRGRVNLTRSERVFLFNTKGNQTNITISNKVDFFIERDFNRHWRLNWKTWSFDSRREFERYGRCIPETDADFDPNSSCTPNPQQIATLGPILEIDYRDNPFLPTKGHYTTYSLDYSDPVLGSSKGINFVRTELGHTRYVQIRSPKYIWANSLRGGYLSNLSPRADSGVPASHAFILGGLSTVRGFGGSGNNERLPPQFEFEVKSGNELIIKNDSYYGLFKSELRFTLVGDHGGVLFYDGGLVQIAGYDFSRPYRDAVGVGYRYNTPLGPLSIDLGFKIDPRTDKDRREERFRIHFSVGTF
ncbi:MAG: outer membrane protein assembly factor, partial [Bdellovibrionales bacterium]